MLQITSSLFICSFKAINFQEKLVVAIYTVCIVLHNIPEFFNAQEKLSIPGLFGIKRDPSRSHVAYRVKESLAAGL